jgi:hypothetical protein
MNQTEKQLKCRPRGKPWPPGVSGNPRGRARGALNKLSLAVRGEPLTVNHQPAQEPVPTLDSVKFDPRRSHEHTMTKIDGAWRRTVKQDGRVFDRDTGVLLA